MEENSSTGFLRYVAGRDLPNQRDGYIEFELVHPLFKWEGVADWRHITITVKRTAGSITLAAWCNNVFCGSVVETKTANGQNDLNSSFTAGTHRLDTSGDAEFERGVAFGWGGQGPFNGFNDTMIWNYWGAGIRLPEEIEEIQKIVSANTVGYEDSEAFDPAVGDVLVVQQVLPDGTVIWCNEPKFPTGAEGDILYQGPGGEEDVFFGPPPLSLPPGGLEGQIVKKQSDDDGDVVWVNETRYVRTWESESDPATSELVVPGDFWVKGAVG
jgi:hypothetical protein